jgi:hypothetical protein
MVKEIANPAHLSVNQDFTRQTKTRSEAATERPDWTAVNSQLPRPTIRQLHEPNSAAFVGKSELPILSSLSCRTKTKFGQSS